MGREGAVISVQQLPTRLLRRDPYCFQWGLLVKCIEDCSLKTPHFAHWDFLLSKRVVLYKEGVME